MTRHAPSRWRMAWLTLGWALLIVAPVIGALPGPGGIFLFAGGAGLLIRHSAWAKRRYVLAKRRWPKLGRAVDRVMRRTKPAPVRPAPVRID